MRSSAAALQQVMLQSARCLVSLGGQVAPAVSCRWPQQQHLDIHKPFVRQPSLQCAAAWGTVSSSSSRGFLSSIIQPESKVYKERRLIG